MKNIYFIILAIFCILYVIQVVRQNKFSIKESFWWFIGSLLVLILAIWPTIIDFVAKKLNISYPPSLLFVICIIFLLFMIFRNSKRISEQQEKIIELAEQVSILKSKVSKNDKKR